MEATFSAPGVSPEFVLQPGMSAAYAISGVFVGSLRLERSTNRSTWDTVFTATAPVSGDVQNDTGVKQLYRYRATALSVGTATVDLDHEESTVQQFGDRSQRIIAELTTRGLVFNDLEAD